MKTATITRPTQPNLFDIQETPPPKKRTADIPSLPPWLAEAAAAISGALDISCHDGQMHILGDGADFWQEWGGGDGNFVVTGNQRSGLIRACKKNLVMPSVPDRRFSSFPKWATVRGVKWFASGVLSEGQGWAVVPYGDAVSFAHPKGSLAASLMFGHSDAKKSYLVDRNNLWLKMGDRLAYLQSSESATQKWHHDAPKYYLEGWKLFGKTGGVIKFDKTGFRCSEQGGGAFFAQTSPVFLGARIRPVCDLSIFNWLNGDIFVQLFNNEVIFSDGNLAVKLKQTIL